VNHPTYGQVWYPRNVARDCDPTRTDTGRIPMITAGFGFRMSPGVGRLFIHGRWAWDNWYAGLVVWVPGRTWAPAWYSGVRAVVMHLGPMPLTLCGNPASV